MTTPSRDESSEPAVQASPTAESANPPPRVTVRAELKRLKKALARRTTPPEELPLIAARIKKLERLQGELTTPKRRGRKQAVHVPEPESYRLAMEKKREAAHAVSGFNSIRARFVQGGAPGSARKG